MYLSEEKRNEIRTRLDKQKFGPGAKESSPTTKAILKSENRNEKV